MTSGCKPTTHRTSTNMLTIDPPIKQTQSAPQPKPMQPNERRRATVTGLGRVYTSSYHGINHGTARRNVYFRLETDLPGWEDLKVNLPAEDAQRFTKGDAIIAILSNLGGGFQIYKPHTLHQRDTATQQALTAQTEAAEEAARTAQTDAVRDVWGNTIDLQRCAHEGHYRTAVIRQLTAIAQPVIAQRRHNQQYGWQGIESPNPA